MAKLIIVGIGPGSADYVTPAARKAVQKANIVIGSKRSADLMRVDIKGEAIVFTAQNLHTTLKYASESIRDGKIVALLSVGDPGFSGLLHTVVDSGLFQREDFEVIAGVSSIQACAARLKISWEGACLFTFHDGNVTDEDKKDLLECLKNGKTAIVLPDQNNFTPERIADFLMKSGVKKNTTIFVCENLTLSEEKVTSTRLREMSGLTFRSLCIIVIKQ